MDGNLASLEEGNVARNEQFDGQGTSALGVLDDGATGRASLNLLAGSSTGHGILKTNVNFGFNSEMEGINGETLLSTRRDGGAQRQILIDHTLNAFILSPMVREW